MKAKYDHDANRKALSAEVQKLSPLAQRGYRDLVAARKELQEYWDTSHEETSKHRSDAETLQARLDNIAALAQNEQASLSAQLRLINTIAHIAGSNR